MSYVKFEHRHFGDDRWLDLSPAAFAVHAWALRHCNEQGTDGEISRKVALRLVCPVMPTGLEGAWRELCAAGFWTETATGFTCPEFLAHGIAAAEQDATRAKWARDKRRQRLHGIGNHQLCTPGRCPAAAASTGGQVDASTPGGADASTGGQVDDPTRPDPTRPDPSGGRVEGGGSSDGPALAGAPPADATAAAASRLGRLPHEYTGDCCPLPDINPIHRSAS